MSDITITVLKEKEAMRAFSRQQRMQGRTVALVPTMVGF